MLGGREETLLRSRVREDTLDATRGGWTRAFSLRPADNVPSWTADPLAREAPMAAEGLALRRMVLVKKVSLKTGCTRLFYIFYRKIFSLATNIRQRKFPQGPTFLSKKLQKYESVT